MCFGTKSGFLTLAAKVDYLIEVELDARDLFCSLQYANDE